ncbi:MAG: tetratricopeptide repeat protein, partial [Gemmatimonadales bacterium]
DYLGKGLLELATAEVNRAVSRGADRGLATSLLGEIYARRGLHGEALERFRSARESHPDDPRTLLGEASALLALSRFSEALSVADQLVGVTPRAPEARVTRARARLATGDAAGASIDIEAAIAEAPGRPDLLLLQGEVFRAVGEPEAALESCRAALAYDARLAPAWMTIAEVEEARGQEGPAREALEQVLRILPVHAGATMRLAELLCRTERPGQAVTRLA